MGIDRQLRSWTRSLKPAIEAKMAPDRHSYDLIVTGVDFDKLASLGLNVGNCIHDLRACLDNLVFALARLHKDPPEDPVQIYFPIFQDEEQFDKRAARTMRQISPLMCEAIRSVQPFQRKGRVVNGVSEGMPADDPMVLLHELEISDKHRIPLSLAMFPEQAGFDASVKFYNEESARKAGPPKANIRVPMEEGQPFCTVAFMEAIEKVSGTADFRMTLMLQTDSRVIPFEGQLPRLTNHVREVIDYISGAFRHAG